MLTSTNNTSYSCLFDGIAELTETFAKKVDKEYEDTNSDASKYFSLLRLASLPLFLFLFFFFFGAWTPMNKSNHR